MSSSNPAVVSAHSASPKSHSEGLARVRNESPRAFWMYVLTEHGMDHGKADQSIRYWEDGRSSSSTHGRSLVLTLHNFGSLPISKLAHAVSVRHNAPLLARRELVPSKEHVTLIGEEKCKQFFCVPLVNGRVAVADPEMAGFPSMKAVLQRQMQGYQLCIAAVDDIRDALDRMHDAERAAEAASSGDDQPSADMIEKDLERAYRLGASDLHLKPGEHTHIVTARIDSECVEFRRLSPSQKKSYVEALKLSSHRGLHGELIAAGQGGPRNRPIDHLNSYEAQDGASMREYSGRRVALRYSSIPTPMGESVVLRLIDHGRIVNLHLSDLGYLPRDESALRSAFKRRTGLNMVLGSTGSGKSTTLYTGIKDIDMDRYRVVTIEDPIECLFSEGPIQIELSEQLPFSKIKPAVMRHDPDVIVVAEVRDIETVKLLAWATLSSHLTWGTLHADTPFLAIRRLLELELDVVTLAGVVDTFCAQTLARRICQHCRREHHAAKFYMENFKPILEKYSVKDPAFWEVNPSGCEHCRRGEKGRTLFAELHQFDERDKDQIAKQGRNYNPVEARRYACERAVNPLKTMREDAIIKAAMGWVSVEEAMSMTSTGDETSGIAAN